MSNCFNFKFCILNPHKILRFVWTLSWMSSCKNFHHLIIRQASLSQLFNYLLLCKLEQNFFKIWIIFFRLGTPYLKSPVGCYISRNSNRNLFCFFISIFINQIVKKDKFNSIFCTIEISRLFKSKNFKVFIFSEFSEIVNSRRRKSYIVSISTGGI